MVCDGYLDLLVNWCCVMDISHLLNIHDCRFTLYFSRWVGNGCTMPTSIQWNLLMVCTNSLMRLRNKSMMVCFVVQAESVRTRRITPQQEPFTVICSKMVSFPITIVGPSMNKEGLCWRMMKKWRAFLTMGMLTMTSLKILQLVSLVLA